MFWNFFNSRVNDTDTTLETIVELTLTTATGEDLSLDNEITTTWNMMFSECVPRRKLSRVVLTDGLGNSLGLFGSIGDLTIGDTDTVLDC